jgi:hypothetical protein
MPAEDPESYTPAYVALAIPAFRRQQHARYLMSGRPQRTLSAACADGRSARCLRHVRMAAAHAVCGRSARQIVPRTLTAVTDDPDAKQTPLRRRGPGRRAIVLAALPGILVTVGIAVSEVYRKGSWSALPFLMSGTGAILVLGLGDRHVSAYETATGSPRRAFNGRLVPTGRRYLSFHAHHAGWRPTWCIAAVWIAWATPVGLFCYLAAWILVDLAAAVYASFA